MTSLLLDRRLNVVMNRMLDQFDQGETFSKSREIIICAECGTILRWREKEMSDLEALSGKSPYVIHLRSCAIWNAVKHQRRYGSLPKARPFTCSPGWTCLTEADIAVMAHWLEERLTDGNSQGKPAEHSEDSEVEA